MPIISVLFMCFAGEPSIALPTGEDGQRVFVFQGEIPE